MPMHHKFGNIALACENRRWVPVVMEQRQRGAKIWQQEVQREPVVVSEWPVHLSKVKSHYRKRDDYGLSHLQ